MFNTDSYSSHDQRKAAGFRDSFKLSWTVERAGRACSTRCGTLTPLVTLRRPLGGTTSGDQPLRWDSADISRHWRTFATSKSRKHIKKLVSALSSIATTLQE